MSGMAAIQSFQLYNFVDTTVSLLVALLLGTLIGAERQYRQRTAGLRTNALVALGAAAFVDAGMTLVGKAGSVQIAAYVVSGVGFLGAGAIMKEGANIRGLNTAATLWCSAAVGVFAGADRVAEATLLAALVLIGNTALRPLVNLINRIPVDDGQTEATYKIHLTASEEARDRVRDLLGERLEAASYPLRDVEVLERDDDEVEIVATLAATSAVAADLDALSVQLGRDRDVRHATWTSSTVD
jgi:putative Mg2+ transporter-C (MgtC) family protein